MIAKNSIVFLILLFQTIVLFGQEAPKVDFLETDSTWGQEIFKFPIQFAKEINFEGVEDARFPKGWGKQDSSSFWSYVFVWNIKWDAILTSQDLEANLQLYFNGLMKAVNKDKDLVLPNTVALFLEKENIDDVVKHKGEVQIYDAFYTKKQMTLNVLVEQQYCETQKKLLVFFRFSPKGFDHEIWSVLNKINLRDNSCNL